jgi:hypothetical protein
LTSSLAGYAIMKDSPILPWYLGGSGKLEAIVDDIPYQKQIPFVLEYSLVFLGFYLDDLVDHLVFKQRG